MQLVINAGTFSAWKKTVFSLPARSYIRTRHRFLNTCLHGQHHSVLRGMCFIDAARPNPMVLFWIWRMIYVTQNNKTVPNSQKNAPVICLNCSSLLGRLCRPTNTFNPNAVWNFCSSCLCSGSTFFFSLLLCLRLVPHFHEPIIELVDFHLSSSWATFTSTSFPCECFSQKSNISTQLILWGRRRIFGLLQLVVLDYKMF